MLKAREFPLSARIRRANVKGTGNQSSGILGRVLPGRN